MGLRYSVLLLVASMVFAEESVDITVEQAEAFAWFDTLGYPDVTGKPYVQVWTGQVSREGNNPPQNTCLSGFLLSEEGPKFTVFTEDIEVQTFERNQASVKPQNRVYHLQADLEEVTKERIHLVRNPPPESGDSFSRLHYGPQVSAEVHEFFLARACAANGLGSLARQLYDAAEARAREAHKYDVEDFLRKGVERTSPRGLKEFVSASLAETETWRWMLAFQNPQVPRTRLFEEFRRVEKGFPDSKCHEYVADLAKHLAEMVREDEIHSKSARPVEELGGTERVAELIYQLREQNGRQLMQPGECNIFADERGELSPAALLVKMGFEAVPQLIEALGDDRPTRSIGFWRNFAFSGHHVLRVGDCAEDILERIAARSFRDSRDVRKDVEAWWAEAQQKGEEGFLIDAVEKGDRHAVVAAQQLLARAPARALTPLARGIANATDDWVRVRLLRVFGEIPGDVPTEFLHEQAVKGSTFQSRVAAIAHLSSRKPEEAIDIALCEWAKVHPCGRDDDEAVDQLIALLAGCGRPEGIQALASGLRTRPMDSRMDVLDAVVGRFWRGGKPEDAPGLTPDAREKIRVAIDDLLVGALDDEEERTGVSGSIGEESYSDPRVCDLAACYLAARWGGKVPFHLSTSTEARNAAITEMKNVWRDEHGLKPLAVPPKMEIAPASEETIAPLLDRLVKDDDLEAESSIEVLGLGALPAVRARLASVATEPARVRLTRLMERLASLVRIVDLEEDVGAFPESVRAALWARKGKPLTFAMLDEMLVLVAEEAKSSHLGIRIVCHRPVDGTGVALTVTSVAAEHVGESGSWACEMSVRLGLQTLLAQGTWCSWDRGRRKTPYDALQEPVEAALSASADQPYHVTVQLRPQR